MVRRTYDAPPWGRGVRAQANLTESRNIPSLPGAHCWLICSLLCLVAPTRWVAAHCAPEIGTEAARGIALAGRVGIRVNPQVGAGSNAQLSTGTATSKFGVGVEDDRARIIAAYKARPWLTMMHCHVGSQGVPIQLAMRGIERTAALAHEINTAVGRTQVRTVDPPPPTPTPLSPSLSLSLSTPPKCGAGSFSRA